MRGTKLHHRLYRKLGGRRASPIRGIAVPAMELVIIRSVHSVDSAAHQEGIA
jgi:hypothetical protein